MSDHGKPRTSEERSADARKLKERKRRAPVDGENPKRREMPKVLTPEERQARASQPVEEVLATVGSDSAEAEEIVIEDDPKPRKKGK